MNDSKEFRELIRVMERKLGLLNKSGGGCCYSVSLAQCHTLVEIGRRPKISINELAQILNLDKSTTSRTVDNLLQKDYVVKNQSESDKRGINVQLTEEGEKVFKDIECKMNCKFKKIFGKIPENKRNEVISSMNIIVKALSED